MMIDTLMAYSEIHEILNLLDNKYKERVPDKVRKFFEEERIKDYVPEIDADTPLIDQNLKRETIVLLSILNLNYWCDTQEEKQNVLATLSENEKERQEIMNKYNPDNLFRGAQEKEHIEEQSVVEYKKQNFVQKILSKLTKLFKK